MSTNSFEVIALGDKVCCGLVNQGLDILGEGMMNDGADEAEGRSREATLGQYTGHASCQGFNWTKARW